MWVMIFVAVFIATAASLLYLWNRIYKFSFWEKIKLTQKKLYRILFSLVPPVLAMLVLFLTMGLMNTAIVFLFLVVFWLLSDLVFFIIEKIRKSKFKRRWAAIPAVCASFIYLLTGWILANNVWITNYEIRSEKDVGELRVVMFADSHVGATFDGKGFAEQVKRMQEQNPDVVIIAGDFVDDDTTYKDMVDACAALGTLQTKYGVYYSFGNHDKGYYDTRGYSGDDLIYELEKNNVQVLQDEAKLIDNRFYIIGRQDLSEESRGEGRSEISELTAPLDSDKFMLVINHHPNDYEKEAAANVDLVLSGHTHGGQMFPVNLIMRMMGVNDRIYGYEQRGNTQFIVTSGISDWAIKFKTGTKSEFVVIDIKSK